jgi:hypothetical protein
MNGLERLAGCMEIQRTINKEEPDEVDRLLEKNGILYNSEEDIDYQDDHESGVDWDSRNEDEDR